VTAATAMTGSHLALLVAAADQVGALTSAVRKLIESPDLRQVMGRVSPERIDRWHYGLAVGGIVQACQEAVGSRRVGRA
jgi:hypothetical protein